MDDDDESLKPRITAISVNELTDEEQALIAGRVLRQINFLAPKETAQPRYFKTNAETTKTKAPPEQGTTKFIQVILTPPGSDFALSESSRPTITPPRLYSATSVTTINTTVTQQSNDIISSTADALGIGRITKKIDKSLPRRKTPAEVYKDCPLEIRFLLGLYEIFIHHSILQKKPPRSMIPYKVRAPGELPHPSVNNTLRFEINSKHYNLLLGGEEKGLGLSRIVHLDSFLIKSYDYSGRNIFSIHRPLTWITFFFGAVFFGNDIEIRNIEERIVGRIRQVQDCNITLHIYNSSEERIMCVKTNISVSRCGFVNMKNCTMKFYDWDDELLYATLVFEGMYTKKRFWNYRRCVESIAMLRFDVEVHPIWKICILSTYFFLFRNYLEERRPIFMGAGLTLIIILFVTILLFCWTISGLRGIYSE